jgi:uncharacterized membrane protein
MLDVIEVFPEWLQIFFGSMIPWLESRYVIPYAILSLEWEWWHAFVLAVFGNILPIPFILKFFHLIEDWLRNFKFWKNLMDWLFARTRKRAIKNIRKYEHIGLLIFVAFPVPFTGAWTGALIAYLFDLKFSKSLITIFIGILIAAGIMTAFTVFGVNPYLMVSGIIIAGIIMALIVALGGREKE